MPKPTFTTQEVANILKVTKKTLLNWLREGKIPEPQRDNSNNYRVWIAEDIAAIQRIKKSA